MDNFFLNTINNFYLQVYISHKCLRFSFDVFLFLNVILYTQCWARAFLVFVLPGGTLSRLGFRALFWALNSALLHSRFRVPALP